MEGGPKRNFFSGMINTNQICIQTITVTFQEAPMIGTCIMNLQEGGESKNI